MKNINHVTAIKNFESISEILIYGAPTEKSRIFAEKLVNSIREKGTDWIFNNAQKLNVTMSPESFSELFPVQDNRNYYLVNFQLALAC